MNQTKKIITYINIGHFIDHYCMLIFVAAVIVMAPAFNMTYGELLPYATPGFVAFGAGALITGWLGDKWSRRNMMAVFFLGMGLSLLGTAAVQNALQLSVMLFIAGLMGSIYHPVGTAMLATHAEKLGKEMGLNGVWGNVGVASSALVTGLINEYFGWRAAFILPAILSLTIGFLFLKQIPSVIDKKERKSLTHTARISKNAMLWVVASLIITVISSSTAFNGITVALPKLFQERLLNITTNTATLGVITFLVYLFGALAQYIIGNLLDKYPLKYVFIPLAVGIVPALYLAAISTDYWLVAIVVFIIICIFGQITVNDTMLGKYTADEWRGRAYAARYFLGFTSAGISVGLVSYFYNEGGFKLLLQVLAIISVVTIAGAFIFPKENTSE
ncbi:MAG: MFS transporter [Betaproteobacteria bacterium]